MKQLGCILLFVFLGLGLVTTYHVEAPDFQTAGNAIGNTVRYAVSDCSFTASPEDTCPPIHHSLFNDENNGHRVSDTLFPGNFYTHNHVLPKLLKLKQHLPAGQLQYPHSSRLFAEQSSSLLFTPGAIRYSCGYYIFALAHILI